MKGDSVEKNILDLSYTRNLQLSNAILLLGGGSALASFTGFILNRNQSFSYALLFFISVLLTYILYSEISVRFKEISSRIRKLRD